jgi:hypothetical protein
MALSQRYRNDIVALSQCYCSAIAVFSQCFRFAIGALSLNYRFAIALLLLCYRSAFTLLLLHGRPVLALSSLCLGSSIALYRSATQFFLFDISLLSPCFRFAPPLLSLYSRSVYARFFALLFAVVLWLWLLCSLCFGCAIAPLLLCFCSDFALLSPCYRCGIFMLSLRYIFALTLSL